MDENVRGRDFLRAQVNNAVVQHKTLLENIEDHERQAGDPRYRDICARHIPVMREQQAALETYLDTIGRPEERGGITSQVASAVTGGEASGVSGLIGTALGKARDVIESANPSDFTRLAGDIVMVRQAQDTFATFAVVGDKLGDARLAEIGRAGEREHDNMQREMNRLARDIFVENTGLGRID